MNKKIVSIFLSVFLFTSNIYASNDYTDIVENVYAVVTKVYDAEAMEVKLVTTGELANVKLLGINSHGYDGGYEYVNNRLLGKTVLITYDITVYTPVKNWNLVYMRESGDLINTKLIELGFAQAELSTSTQTIYNKYLRLQSSAKNNSIGMWEDKGLVPSDKSSSSQYYYDTNTININTATEYQLRASLDGVSSNLASNIVSYRQHNPFNRIEEIKFVEGMTKEIYDKNIRLMHVITNINKAKHTELNSLKNISSSEADDIIKYRDKNGQIYIKNLVNDNIMTSNDFSSNEKFISNVDENYLVVSEPEKVANINTATRSELTGAGLSSNDASTIIKLREEGYSFKNIGELELIDDLSITRSTLQKLEDNLTVKTNLNMANKYELTSIFGGSYAGMTSDLNTIINKRNYKKIEEIRDIIGETRYDKIAPFIYIDSYSNDFTNINTATVDELIDLGISTSYARSIVEKSKKIDDFSDIPVNIKDFDEKITLYTNINNTSINELLSLNSEMTSSFANELIDYAKEQPFGSHTELRKYMDDNNLSELYNKIKEFIVFR